MNEEKKYEEALAQLEAIVRKLEAGECDIDEIAFTAFQFTHNGFELGECFFVFQVLVHLTMDLMVPFSTFVSISSPGCS